MNVEALDEYSPHMVLDEGQPAEFSFDATDVAKGSSMPLAMRWGGQEVVIHGQPIHHENYRYAILKYTLQGTGTYVSGDDRWRIVPGTVIWAAPRCKTELSVEPGETLVNRAVILFGTTLHDLMAELFPSPIGAVETVHPELVAQVMRTMLDECRYPGAYREENCAALARVLIHRIADAVRADQHAGVLSRQSYQRCRKYIADHYPELSSLNDVAQACGLTLPYVCRLFDQFGDKSAYEYLTQLKIAHAERLLLTGREAVKEVASAVGYGDVRSFARNFKTVFGVSPRDYRRSHA